MQWVSRKGNCRNSNNDAAALVITEQYLFAFVVDAAEKGGNGTNLAQRWAKTNAQRIIELPEPPYPVNIIDTMRETHTLLRTDFLHERASYCALLLHHKTQNSWAIHCGDCRLGSQKEGNTTWLTNVHTLANPYGEYFTLEDSKNPDRHTLTRCINARRFERPDVKKIPWGTDLNWILCSDGFWADHIDQNIPLEQLEDDASCLAISGNLTDIEHNHDSDNIIVYRR